MLNTRSVIQNKILSYFFLNEESRVYVNEMARLIESDPKNVYRMLLRLEEEGILGSEFKGKERYFFCQKKNPLFKGYREIFLKTAGLEYILKRRLKGVSELREAYIFGSFAKKQFRPDSDVDILLVGDHDALETQKILHAVQKETGREISVVNMRSKEFQEKKTRGDQFIKSVFADKVIQFI